MSLAMCFDWYCQFPNSSAGSGCDLLHLQLSTWVRPAVSNVLHLIPSLDILLQQIQIMWRMSIGMEPTRSRLAKVNSQALQRYGYWLARPSNIDAAWHPLTTSGDTTLGAQLEVDTGKSHHQLLSRPDFPYLWWMLTLSCVGGQNKRQKAHQFDGRLRVAGRRLRFGVRWAS